MKEAITSEDQFFALPDKDMSLENLKDPAGAIEPLATVAALLWSHPDKKIPGNREVFP